jgi:ABC-type uncharacterized transport system ATPase subunit
MSAVAAVTGPKVLELSGISKRFGPVVACDGVSLDVHAGQIHGLLGENGAGKSTLMKVLAGLHHPDAGLISIGGRPVSFRAPTDAARAGVAMVHQHFSLVPRLRVWENFVLGERGVVRAREARRRMAELGDQYGLQVDPDAVVAELTVGQRQRVEIIKCFRSEPQIIVLDEPTSVLTQAESTVLFDVLRRVAASEGRAVVLISHKLDEIMRATDVATVMRRGRVVHHGPTSATTPAELAQHMVGRPVALDRESVAVGGGAVTPAHEHAHGSGAAPVLALDEVTVRVPGRDQPVLDGLTLRIAAGSVYGLAGVEGNGQVPLGSVLAGTLPVTSGRVVVEGREVDTSRPGALAGAGVAIVTEDRHLDGCALDMSVADNLNLFHLDDLSHRGVLDRRAAHARAVRLIEQFSISCPSPDTPFRVLSGGNQQRVVLARELDRGPRVLVAAQPTRGLDVGAIEFVIDQIRAAADRGTAVLFISTELDEVLAVSDRIGVISRGRIVGEFDRDDVDIDEVGLLLGGSQRSAVP